MYKLIRKSTFSNYKEYTNFQAVIQVKYLDNARKKDVKLKKQEALQEIQKYFENDKIAEMNFKKYIVIFVDKKLELFEEV